MQSVGDRPPGQRMEESGLGSEKGCDPAGLYFQPCSMRRPRGTKGPWLPAIAGWLGGRDTHPREVKRGLRQLLCTSSSRQGPGTSPVALSSTFALLHSCSRHCELFPGKKDDFATRKSGSGQSVMSPYHREFEVQVLHVSGEAREASWSKVGFLGSTPRP